MSTLTQKAITARNSLNCRLKGVTAVFKGLPELSVCLAFFCSRTKAISTITPTPCPSTGDIRPLSMVALATSAQMNGPVIAEKRPTMP